jgi:NAD-dependent deacetylase sirtuin 1
MTINSDFFKIIKEGCPNAFSEHLPLKPDIVFFGEGLPEIYHQSINEDKSKCDLLIVIGSSLKVKPVANIPQVLNFFLFSFFTHNFYKLFFNRFSQLMCRRF